jgi:acyl carrier protein
VDDTIREVLAAHGRLAVDAASLDREANLYEAGLTSHASVTVMLALEDAFDVEFPDRLLTKATFSSIAAIEAALAEAMAVSA